MLTNGEKTDIVKSTKENGRKKQKERTDHREHNELPHKLESEGMDPRKRNEVPQSETKEQKKKGFSPMHSSNL